MRLLLLLIPVALVAKAQTSSTQTSTAHPKASTAAKSTGTGSGHPAVRKPAVVKPQGVTLTTDEQKTVYAIGLFIYQRSIEQLDLTPDELAIVKQAMSDAAAGKPVEKLDDFRDKLQTFANARTAQKAEQMKAASAAFLAKAATEPGAVKTDSGLIYNEVTAGTGPTPAATDTVKVNYRGTLTDGTEFDSSYKRNEPAQFPLDHVIKCWTEGLQKMKVGGKAVLICPSGLAYGDHGQPGIPPGSVLKFEVELLGIVPAGSAK
ncbi:MAG TPA: FKBP-type peptidyl-prolyl cis-trans isomerase [Bryobacteraceae bacterium]|nr:FKBP-type peptidyl-prolyl cis-trans isomerase [Bryobacteraceae bacterium]